MEGSADGDTVFLSQREGREMLRQHAHRMPRTALRYAIERMPEAERRQWMKYSGEKTIPGT